MIYYCYHVFLPATIRQAISQPRVCGLFYTHRTRVHPCPGSMNAVVAFALSTRSVGNAIGLGRATTIYAAFGFRLSKDLGLEILSLHQSQRVALSLRHIARLLTTICL